MTIRIASWLTAAIAMAAMGAAPAGAQSGPAYDSYAQSYSIPYAEGSGIRQGRLAINVEVGGHALTLQLDTGSRGLWINRNYAPPGATSGVPGYIFYWSSGIAHVGYWAPLQLTFPDAVAHGGAQATASASVPVLIVTKAVCLAGPWPNACNPASMPTLGEGYMGVGFDRTGHGTGYGSDVIKPARPGTSANLQILNPFLNLADMKAGSMRSGYILSQQGITLGLTAENTGAGYQGGSSPYAYAKLDPTGTPSVPGAPTDWKVMAGSVVIGGKTYASQQAVLDIGISNMLLTTQAASLPGQVESEGHPYLSAATGRLQVNLLGEPGRAGYSFDVPDPPQTSPTQGHASVTPTNVAISPAQPVWWSGERPETLVNTGIYALNAFNYLYDAGGGYIGLQLNGTPGASSAFLHP